MKVLVVAPQFPAINQPWIDTYLEQLLTHGFSLGIYSSVTQLAEYSPKVDKLQLRQMILPLSFGPLSVATGVFRALLRFNLKVLIESLSVARKTGTDLRTICGGVVTCLHLAQDFLDGFSVVHSHDEVLAYKFLFLARTHRIPLVLTFHGLPPAGVGQLNTAKRVILYEAVSRVFVNTEFAKRQVCSLGCDPNKVVVLPQGLPIEEFLFRPKEPPVEFEVVRLLTVGRYHRDKGQGYALLALKRLLNKGLNAEWTFVGVGPDLYRLRKLAERLGLTKSVRFLVAISPQELQRLYHDSHLFVLPSVNNPGGHVETQGVVLQEAQSSGCIPIASRVGGIPECLHDGEDALLVRQKSSRDLVEKIMYLYTRPEIWRDFQQAGRQNVEKKLSATVIGRKMAQMLNEVMVIPPNNGNPPE